MSEEPREPSLISFRIALLLFALLLAGAGFFLKGNLRFVMVVVILGLVGKSIVHYLRMRAE